MSQNEPNESKEPITDRDTVRERVLSTIKHQTGNKRRDTVKEASLFQILSSSNVDIGVVSKVLADEVSDKGQVAIELDGDETHCYRLMEDDK